MNKTKQNVESIAAHPLTQIIERYCDEFESIREANLDVPPVRFHRDYGLNLEVPVGWDVLGSVKHIIDSFSNEHKIVIIFSSTLAYKQLSAMLGDRIQYFSWHEIFTGMHLAHMDMRYIQRSKKILSEADLSFFIDPPDVPEVMDQVRGQVSGGLVILSGSGIEK